MKAAIQADFISACTSAKWASKSGRSEGLVGDQLEERAVHENGGRQDDIGFGPGRWADGRIAVGCLWSRRGVVSI